MSSEVLVRMSHIRKARFCASGTREWFARQGWSWSEFLTNGRPASDFEATGDPLGAQVAEIAREEAARGR
jgi:hypothetical protein